jgi:hypothetical protein
MAGKDLYLTVFPTQCVKHLPPTEGVPGLDMYRRLEWSLASTVMLPLGPSRKDTTLLPDMEDSSSRISVY